MARRHLALLRTAYLLTGDRHTAEDLVQTALSRAWLAWPHIREPARADAYVRRTLVNTQRSFWRRRRVPELLLGSVPEPRQGAVEVGATFDLHQVLWTALAELPRQQRVTLVLRYYEDLSDLEIARVLGVSVGTVKSNASRALVSLRRRADAAAGLTQPSRASRALERPERRPQQRVEPVLLRRREVRQQLLLPSQSGGDGAVHELGAALGECDEDAAAVVRIGRPLHQS